MNQELLRLDKPLLYICSRCDNFYKEEYFFARGDNHICEECKLKRLKKKHGLNKM